jgi:hypothetical protein
MPAEFKTSEINTEARSKVSHELSSIVSIDSQIFPQPCRPLDTRRIVPGKFRDESNHCIVGITVHQLVSVGFFPPPSVFSAPFFPVAPSSDIPGIAPQSIESVRPIPRTTISAAPPSKRIPLHNLGT